MLPAPGCIWNQPVCSTFEMVMSLQCNASAYKALQGIMWYLSLLFTRLT